MMKLHCDICDHIIDPIKENYHKLEKMSLGNFKVSERDICEECYNALERFTKEELNHE